MSCPLLGVMKDSNAACGRPLTSQMWFGPRFSSAQTPWPLRTPESSPEKTEVDAKLRYDDFLKYGTQGT